MTGDRPTTGTPTTRGATTGATAGGSATSGRHTASRSPGDVVIRLAGGDDLEGVVAVGRTAWQTTYTSILPPEILELFLAKWWTKDANVPAIRGRRTFVADRGGEIVGMATYGTHEGHLVVWKIYVLAEAQGQGIGRRLLDAIYERAGEGHEWVYLSFTDGNASAHDFARSHGYVEAYREAQTGLPDLIWMRRALAGGEADPAGFDQPEPPAPRSEQSGPHTEEA